MHQPQHTADEGLATWVERWVPSDPTIWHGWQTSLPPELRGEALFPLQATLCGLEALRGLENQSLELTSNDFRGHLEAARAAYAWALQLSNDLRAASRDVGVEPVLSLDSLRGSLADVGYVSERLLELPVIDAGSFHSSCDMFLRDLQRNEFFRPPRALEISNEPFLSLLRLHRLLGVAAQQLNGADGGPRAITIVAGVRRDLRELAHFVGARGGDALAADLTPALAALETEAMLPDGGTSDDESITQRIHGCLLEVRLALKATAKRLCDSSKRPEEDEEASRRHSERVPVDLTHEVWAFRLIVRAFLAKVEAFILEGSEARDPARLAFVTEFVRHFRVFGPRLVKGTAYSDRGPLATAVSALGQLDELDVERLAQAVVECERFAEHLESALETRFDSAAAFDKQRAADELRGYLEVAKRQPGRLHDLG